jgi:hypothetical protein
MLKDKQLTQPLGHQLCIPFVAIAVAGKTLDDFFLWHYLNGYCYSEGHYSLLEPRAYFVNYDLEDFCSMYGIELKFYNASNNQVPKDFLGDDGLLSGVEYVFICDGFTSLLSGKIYHALYWDGYNLYDPDFPTLSNRPIDQYKVVQYAQVKRN